MLILPTCMQPQDVDVIVYIKLDKNAFSTIENYYQFLFLLKKTCVCLVKC